MAINCAHMITELYSNAMKYAFKQKSTGIINICVFQHESEKLELVFKDNESELAEIDNLYHSKNIGFQLLLAGVEQLKGNLDIVSNNGV